MTSTAAACAVEMRGSKASLSCSRGAITAAAEPSVKRQMQASVGKAAVTWTDGSTCGVEEGGTCQLTICGVQGNRPLDLQLVVVNATGDPEKLWGIVCIAGNSKVVIKVRWGALQYTCTSSAADACAGVAVQLLL